LKTVIRFKQLIILITILAFTFSCSEEKNNSDRFSVNVRLKGDPGRLIPFFSAGSIGREVYPFLFLQLGEYNPKTLQLEPILAKSIPQRESINYGEQAGQNKYSFEILDDAVWVDGKPITGHDYSFTIKALKHPLVKAGGAYKAAMSDIIEVRVDKNNPKRFDVFTKSGYMLDLELITSIEIIPAHVYDVNSVLANYLFEDFNDEKLITERSEKDTLVQKFALDFNSTQFNLEVMSGAGPYTLKEWEPDQYIVLEKKEDWWGDKYPDRTFLNAIPDQIVFHIIPEENTALTLLKNGTIDIMSFSDGTIYESLKKNKDLQEEFTFHEPQKLNYYLLLLNNREAGLNDKLVRKALAQLIDVDNIIEVLEKGMGVRQTSVISPFDDDFNKALSPLNLDIDNARDLLDAAGWEDSNSNEILDKNQGGRLIELEFDILVTQAQLGQRIALLLQENARKVGIKINIEQQDFRVTRKENLATGKYDIIAFRSITSLADYDAYNTWHSNNAMPVNGNYSGYSNPVADELIEQIRATNKASDRDPLYQELQEIIYEDQPVIFLYAPVEKIAVSKRVKPLISVKRPGYFPNAFELN